MTITPGNGPMNTGRADPKGDGRRPSQGVSQWWRICSLLLVGVVIVAALLPIASSHESKVVRTQVDWFRYTVAGGPAAVKAGLNATFVDGLKFCPPSDAINVPTVSLLWDTTPELQVVDVRLWTLLPPTPSHPLGVPVVLYEGWNATSGGTSFTSAYPFPCDNNWILDDNSTSSVEISAVLTLTYNYTAIVTTYPIP